MRTVLLTVAIGVALAAAPLAQTSNFSNIDCSGTLTVDGASTLTGAVSLGSTLSTSSGVTVTAGGLTVTAGGATVTAGDVTISNGALVLDHDAQALAAAATDISVSGVSVITVTGDAGANTITTMSGGATGQVVTLVFVDALVTMTDGGTLKLNGAGNFTSSADDTMTLVYTGTNWYEIARSVN